MSFKDPCFNTGCKKYMKYQYSILRYWGAVEAKKTKCTKSLKQEEPFPFQISEAQQNPSKIDTMKNTPSYDSQITEN